MTSRKLIPSILVILLSSLFVGAHPAAADSSHARIIRLSLVQGDVRFARETHGDPLADSKAGGENAELNLPIRQGYVLATDNGRVEVELENGPMALLKENTVLEIYDLSLNAVAPTTRPVLRQGSASFYVKPASGSRRDPGTGIHRVAILPPGIRRSVCLWRLFLLRGLWIRLEAVWRGPRLVPIHEWAMDHGSRFWLDLAQRSAVGLGSLSLWGMAFRRLLRR